MRRASAAGAVAEEKFLAGESGLAVGDALVVGGAGAISNAAPGAGRNLALVSFEKMVSDEKAVEAVKTTPCAISSLPASLSAFGMPSKSQIIFDV